MMSHDEFLSIKNGNEILLRIGMLVEIGIRWKRGWAKCLEGRRKKSKRRRKEENKTVKGREKSSAYEYVVRQIVRISVRVCECVCE